MSHVRRRLEAVSHVSCTYAVAWKRESRALSPVSWRMAPVVVVHVRPGGREEHQQIHILMLF